MTTLTAQQEQLCRQTKWNFSDLRALFINCTLKRSPELSHTQGLADISIEIMRSLGVTVDVVRAIDHDVATGVWPNMTDHGWERDDWPAIFELVDAAHILVLCTPIWLGEKSSVCTQIIERLYGNSHLLNDAGQYVYYGRVGGCLVTGNEDGVKHCAMNVLYSLQLPVDVVREMGAEIVIAISAMQPVSAETATLLTRVSRGLNRLNPLAYLNGRLHSLNLLDIVMNAFQVTEYQLGEYLARSADVVVRPNLAAHTWIEFYRAPEIIECGSEATRHAIPQIERVMADRLSHELPLASPHPRVRGQAPCSP